jgi:AAA+ superfamily predicted ATPase
MKPYDNIEHLLDELSRIDLLIRSHLESLREEFPENVDEFRGLYVSEAEIEQIRRNPGFGGRQEILREIRTERLNEIDGRRIEIDAKKEESLKKGAELRLQVLSELFDLDLYEQDILLLGLAPELNLRYEKLYSYLQNDVTKKKPTVDLVLTLLFTTIEEKIKSRTYFLPVASLRKNHLIHLLDGEANTGSSLISSFIKIDERIINFLLGFDELDQRIRNFSYVIKPKKSFDDLILPVNFTTKLTSIASWYKKNKLPPKLLFCGSSGSGKKTAAQAICRELGINLLIVDSKVLLEERSIDIANLVMREALLQNSALYVQAFDVLLEGEESKNSRESLIQTIRTFPGLIFLAGTVSMEFDKGLINNGFVPYSFPLPSYSVRKQLWESCLKDFMLEKEVNMNALASKFKFSGGQIKDAARTAYGLAGDKNSSSSVISMEALYKGCKVQSSKDLSAFARQIDPHYTWKDIVLPKDKKDHLEEVAGFIKYKDTVYSDWGFDKKLSLGKGLNVLFSGPSGTGKTMAAEIIANYVELDLYKIDLSCVISKYIGETEKNLNNIFKRAETSNAILFFDEADALFGKRSEVRDSHDRYANIEINYLLQKMEEYEGITILATNLRQNLDEAFVRRLHIIVDFPFPDEESRLNIWKNVFPQETPIGNDVDYDILAREVKLSGGNIKNIALTAAFYAAEEGGAIRMSHIVQAVRREYQKLGRTWNVFHYD